MRKGKIIPNGVVLQMHEVATVVFFTELGYDVELIVPSQIKGARTPDIRMRKLEWEMKAPVGTSSNTIKRSFKSALKQSKNIIFDLRNSKVTDETNIAKLEKEFGDIKSVRSLMVITKSHGLIEMNK